MCDGSSLFDGSTLQHLTPQAWAAQRERIVAGARAERRHINRQVTKAARRSIRLIARAGRGLLDALWRGAVRYLERQKRLGELHQLAAMSDRELRDIGISRNEIRNAIRSGAIEMPCDHTWRPL